MAQNALEGINLYLSCFQDGFNNQGKLTTGTTTFFHVASFAIRFFVPLYFWKESFYTLAFLHSDNNHKEKVASETNTFGWVGPVVSPVQSNCRIL